MPATWELRLVGVYILLASTFLLSCISSAANAQGQTYRRIAERIEEEDEFIARKILQASIGRRKERGKSHGIFPGCSIYILDVNEIAKKHGLPQCDLSNVVVDARTQVPYLRKFSYTNKEKKVIPTPHYFSGNSAPWFTKKAVERSPYWTQDISNATVILVDDYCYKLWWLSYVHSDTKDQLPGTTLMEIYTHLLQTPEWVAHNGTRHVFFQSHTGFAHGRLGDQYERFLCWQLINAMHVVNVHAQRLKCPWYNPQDFIIAPGSVHYADIQEFQRAENQRMQRAVERDSHLKRDFLVFFKGKCTPLKFDWKELAVTNKIAESVVNVGKLMRYEVVNAIKGLGREIRVGCTGDMGEMEVKDERPHWEQMDAYMKSTFCLMLPGDSQTSRRLPESIMAGCIPVFPGPPYHTAAFASQVEYHKFAIFFKFNATPWTDSITVRWKADHGGVPGKKPHHPTDAEWWVPDVSNVDNLVVSVNGPVEMVKYLRDMPASRIREKQHALQKVQPKFAYLEHSGVEKRDPSAADVIVDAMCQRWENQRKQEKGQA